MDKLGRGPVNGGVFSFDVKVYIWICQIFVMRMYLFCNIFIRLNIYKGYEYINVGY